ncbi:probable septum site-determining protein MinC [Anaerolineaceae bacterium]|nr:probable septum site-determining protein MinC [Anaerolineaceae bacterium]
MAVPIAMSELIAVKGIQEGLLVTLPSGAWADLEPVLYARMQEEDQFFRGARIILQVGKRELKAADLGRLRDKFGDLEINLTAVLSEARLTQQAAKALGLQTQLAKTPARVAAAAAAKLEPGLTMAALMQQTLRSGRTINHAGHVVVIGDVNPGAEILAGGSVVVWGRLYGVVHAGAAGDVEATVCALDLSPQQLRIGKLITTSPVRRGQPEPEMAHVRDGQIVAERWVPKDKFKRLA